MESNGSRQLPVLSVAEVIISESWPLGNQEVILGLFLSGLNHQQIKKFIFPYVGLITGGYSLLNTFLETLIDVSLITQNGVGEWCNSA